MSATASMEKASLARKGPNASTVKITCLRRRSSSHQRLAIYASSPRAITGSSSVYKEDEPRRTSREDHPASASIKMRSVSAHFPHPESQRANEKMKAYPSVWPRGLTATFGTVDF
ncbi:hypothetical protein AGR3A_Cc190038 [Agrobacterium tomkonis CFBP 6623]|uniref:Uncharacterized protein n=1 Tax=Agrobacterium tomkonis CFBP 6623 TaxID=1183432 RepID=A0A1S7P0E7_9HYPH|nr:hypothetical protein AGR3A_Cc190038 [Agrobacterium tomkonis CFBP 6623]